MIFLTEARIDHLEAALRRESLPHGLSDTYAWHKAVWQAFPDRKGELRNFLTRLDRNQKGYRLLIVSQTLPRKPTWWTSDQWRTKEIPGNYFHHSRYAFEARVNPTKKIRIGSTEKGDRKKNGARIPLATPEDLVNWIDRKGQAGGFTIERNSLLINPEGKESFIRQSKQGSHNGVNFQGILQVTDPELFQKTFTQGIGSAKAFGFGLLIIAPIHAKKS